MRPLANKFMAVNAAAALVGIAAVVAAARSVLISPAAAPCIERYHKMTAFNLERGGVALTAADLQASLDGKDVGVIDNITIGPMQGVPLAMAVALRKPESAGSADARSGATFPWEPRVLQGKASACLSYSVLLPAGFDFERGGALPGISGAGPDEQGDKFAARLAWRPKATGGATVRVTENGASRAFPAEQEAFAFPQGRWVKLEQEVVLNTPKKSDGVLRVWVDGTLAIERTNLNYRAKPDVTIAGVSAGAFYDDIRAAPKETKLWLTSLQVRWQ